MLRHEQRRSALVHRKLHRPDLHARFSPTAMGFGGESQPTTIDNPIINRPTQTLEPISVSVLPTTSVPIVVRPTTTSVPVVQPSTSSPTPVTPSTSSTPTSVAPLSTSSSTILSSSSTSSTTPTTQATTSATTASRAPTTSVPHSVSSTDLGAGNAAASASASSSASTVQKSSSNTGGIVGGVAAGVIGFILIGIIVAFFLRRRRGRNESVDFHPDSFRKSAVMLDDPPTHAETVQRGFNPPPSMAQRQNSTGRGSFGTQYGQPGPNASRSTPGYGATQQHLQQYSPPQPPYSPSYVQQYPHTPNSAAPLMYSQQYSPQESYSPSQVSYTSSTQPYAYSSQTTPYSPIAHSMQSFNPAAYGSKGDPILSAQFLTRTVTSDSDIDRTLSRKTSAGTVGTKANPRSTQLFTRMQSDEVQYATYPETSNDSAHHSVPLPSSDYVDLSRTSVTPFQAAQYVEISKKIDTLPPKGLDTPACDAYIQQKRLDSSDEDSDGDEEVQKEDGPFADLAHARQSKQSLRQSVQTTNSEMDDVQELDFPVPPSPALTTSSRYKFEAPPTPPPTLPEIRVQSRSSFGSYDFPMSIRGSHVPGEALTVGSSFPSTPSPLASSFVIQTPPAGKSEFTATIASPPGGAAVEATSSAQEEKKRPETVYDPEDAYGGI